MFVFLRANVLPHCIVSRTRLPRPDVPASFIVLFLLTGFGVPTRAQSVKRKAAGESFKNLKIISALPARDRLNRSREQVVAA